MPKQYEAIRDSLLKEGKPRAEAERIAAATYNKDRKPGQKPVTGNYEKKKSNIIQLETLEKGNTPLR